MTVRSKLFSSVAKRIQTGGLFNIAGRPWLIESQDSLNVVLLGQKASALRQPGMLLNIASFAHLEPNKNYEFVVGEKQSWTQAEDISNENSAGKALERYLGKTFGEPVFTQSRRCFDAKSRPTVEFDGVFIVAGQIVFMEMKHILANDHILEMDKRISLYLDHVAPSLKTFKVVRVFATNLAKIDGDILKSEDLVVIPGGARYEVYLSSVWKKQAEELEKTAQNTG